MYAFTLNKQAYTIPEKAYELTIGQFIAIRNLKPDDELGLLTILMGEAPQVNIQSAEEAEQLSKELSGAYALIGMLKEDLDLCITSGVLLAQPKRVQLLGMDIEIKDNFVNSAPYWGYVHTKSAIQERIKFGKDEAFDATDMIPGIIAHNLYCLVTKNSYNEEAAEKFKADVLTEMSFIQAMQLGNFFLFQQKSLWVSRRKRLRTYLQRLKSTLVYRLLTNTARPTFSIPLPTGVYFDGKK